MLMTLLKNIHQQCNRMPLIWGSSDVFLWLDGSFTLLSKITHTCDVVSFLVLHIKGLVMSLCLIPSDVYLDPLVKMVSAKVTIFPFAVDKYLGRHTSDYANLFLLKPFLKISLILVFIRGFLSVTNYDWSYCITIVLYFPLFLLCFH